MWVAIREEKDARVPAICSMHAVSEVIGSWKVKGKREREREREEKMARTWKTKTNQQRAAAAAAPWTRVLD